VEPHPAAVDLGLIAVPELLDERYKLRFDGEPRTITLDVRRMKYQEKCLSTIPTGAALALLTVSPRVQQSFVRQGAADSTTPLPFALDYRRWQPHSPLAPVNEQAAPAPPAPGDKLPGETVASLVKEAADIVRGIVMRGMDCDESGSDEIDMRPGSPLPL